MQYAYPFIYTRINAFTHQIYDQSIKINEHFLLIIIYLLINILKIISLYLHDPQWPQMTYGIGEVPSVKALPNGIKNISRQ